MPFRKFGPWRHALFRDQASRMIDHVPQEPEPQLVTIELFGVPRRHAGTPAIHVRAGDLGQAIRALERACPGLVGPVIQDGHLLAAYRVSINGLSFVTDPATRLSSGDCVLVIAADAGG